MDKELFVQNVKYLCKLSGISVTNACAESGAGKNLMNTMMTQKSIPSVERVQLLAAYLGVTTSELLGEVPIGTPPNDILTPEARKVAEAYQRASGKDQSVVRTILEVMP